VDTLEVQGVGLRRTYRNLPGPVSHPQRARSRTGPTHPVLREVAGTGWGLLSKERSSLPGMEKRGAASSPIRGGAVREYIDEKKWAEAEVQVPLVAKVLEDVAAAIGKAADELEKATAQGH